MSRPRLDPFEPTKKRNKVSLGELSKKYKDEKRETERLARSLRIEKALEKGKSLSQEKNILTNHLIEADMPPEVQKMRKRNRRFGKFWLPIFVVIYACCCAKALYLLVQSGASFF